MEVIEKKDLLNLASDPFVRSILAPQGTLMLTIFFRGNILVMHCHKVQPLWVQAGKKAYSD
jgi:hypothetical protein